MSRINNFDPRLLDFVTWSVLRGIRLFQRVRVTPKGLIANTNIPQYDFAAVVPAKAVLSVLNVVEDPSFPMKVSPDNLGKELEWWPDLTWGSLCFVGLLARCWITGNVKGVQSYLDVLPFDPAMPIGKVAEAAQRTPEYRSATRALCELTRASEDNFDLAFRHAYCLFRRHGVPLWSATGGGHPYFGNSPLCSGAAGQKAASSGEVIGMVPIVDMAAHSALPNAALGFPDADMTRWLAEERGIVSSSSEQYIVLQALRDIKEGEVITMDRNQFYGFDRETFNAWFGFPYDVPIVDMPAGENKKVEPKTTPPQQTPK